MLIYTCCPICGRECSYIYLINRQAAGCEHCMSRVSIHDYVWTKEVLG